MRAGRRARTAPTRSHARVLRTAVQGASPPTLPMVATPEVGPRVRGPRGGYELGNGALTGCRKSAAGVPRRGGLTAILADCRSRRGTHQSFFNALLVARPGPGKHALSTPELIADLRAHLKNRRERPEAREETGSVRKDAEDFRPTIPGAQQVYEMRSSRGNRPSPGASVTASRPGRLSYKDTPPRRSGTYPLYCSRASR
jgi:hypothetical protein